MRKRRRRKADIDEFEVVMHTHTHTIPTGTLQPAAQGMNESECSGSCARDDLEE